MQQISTERLKDLAQLDGQGDPLGIVHEIEVWPYKKMVYAQPRICPGEWHTKIPLISWDINGSPNLGQTSSPNNKLQKRENLLDCGLCCPSGPQSIVEIMQKEE